MRVKSIKSFSVLNVDKVSPISKRSFLLNVNMQLSKEDFIKKKSSLKKCFKKIAFRNIIMNGIELEHAVARLRVACFSIVGDRHRMHLYRREGVLVIKDIIKRTDPVMLSFLQMVHIMWAFLTVVHHYHSRLIVKFGIVSWSRQKEFNKVAKILDDLLEYLPKDSHVVILSSVLTFFKVGKLWENEQVCHLALGKTILFTGNIEESLMFIIHTAEEWSLTDESQAKDVIQILYEMMEFLKCHELSNNFMDKLLTMYQYSIDPTPFDLYNYRCLRPGIQYCIKVCIKNFPIQRKSNLLNMILNVVDTKDLSEDAVIDFGLLAEMAAFRLMYKSKMPYIPNDILSLCFKFIESSCVYKCLLGLVVYQNLWDRYINRPYFSTPIIFQDEGNYNLTFANYTTESKNYFNNEIKDLFQNSFLNCLKHNPDNKLVLENVFTCIALNMCDLPCGLVASSAACLVMKIQEYATNYASKLTFEHQFHLHAMVVSVLSLICYIFKADDLYEYVNKIIRARAMYAPHLSPPLRESYEYAPHHILYQYNEFFVEDWELRYGLWKCFREQKEINIRERISSIFPSSSFNINR